MAVVVTQEHRAGFYWEVESLMQTGRITFCFVLLIGSNEENEGMDVELNL